MTRRKTFSLFILNICFLLEKVYDNNCNFHCMKSFFHEDHKLLLKIQWTQRVLCLFVNASSLRFLFKLIDHITVLFNLKILLWLSFQNRQSILDISFSHWQRNNGIYCMHQNSSISLYYETRITWHISPLNTTASQKFWGTKTISGSCYYHVWDGKYWINQSHRKIIHLFLSHVIFGYHSSEIHYNQFLWFIRI